MHKHLLFLNRGLFFYLLIVMLLSTATSGYAQTLTITSPPTWSTTQNLDTLYTAAGGSGDHTALVSGVVDVPTSQGTGVYAANISLWTLTNTGAIRGDSGVNLGRGGTVINQNEITARALNGSGVYLANGVGPLNSVTNSGTITAGLSAAIGGFGVNLVGSPTKNVVDNSGYIYAYGDGDTTTSRGTAVLLNGGGTVTNRAGGIITGGYGTTSGIGVYLFGDGTLENFGQITGNNYQGVRISGGGTVTNRTGGTITANGATIGVNIARGTGVVTNETGASITGGRNGVVISGTTGVVTNAGTITGVHADYYGVRFSNAAGGTYTTTATNSNSISGGKAGVSVNFSNATAIATNNISNSGAITATNGSGLLVEGSGTFTNIVHNFGKITGTTFGAQLNTGSINNSGTIQGQTGISFTGTGTGADSLVNSGTIAGSAGTAVQMGGGADSVTLNTGSIITGTIDGGGGSDTLTLLGSGRIGTGQLLNFETIIKDGLEKWILEGTGSIGGNLNINQGELAASGMITGNVTVGNDGMLSPGNSPGTFTINGNFLSSGSLEFEIGGLGAGLYDVLDINGVATFTGGNIHFDFTNGFNAQAGDYWNFLFADSINGWDKLTFDFHGLGTGLGWEFENIAGGERLLITQSGGESTVPEPTTMLLVCLGLVGIAGVKRKCKT